MGDIRMDDGFATYITIANNPNIKFYEKEVTPPGWSAGGAVDTTTMRNIAYRTQSPKKLKTLSPVSATVAYAASAWDAIKAQIGVNQLITVTFPDGASVEFWGWIDEFTPGANTEGEQPTATLTVQPSLHDNTGAEVAPLYVEASGSES